MLTEWSKDKWRSTPYPSLNHPRTPLKQRISSKKAEYLPLSIEVPDPVDLFRSDLDVAHIPGRSGQLCRIGLLLFDGGYILGDVLFDTFVQPGFESWPIAHPEEDLQPHKEWGKEHSLH
jgi:hypothetical protein